jgi:hypothetical protein
MAKKPKVVKVKSAIEQIQEDKKLKKFLRRCKQGAFNLDTKRMVFDINNMHKSRLARRLKTKDLIRNFQNIFIEADLQNIAYRSRIVEIRMQCFETLEDLDQYLSLIKKHLKANYSEAMKKLYTTQADRDALIDSFLQPAISRKKRMAMVIAYSDMVINDIDASGFNFKRIVDTVKISVERKTVL